MVGGKRFLKEKEKCNNETFVKGGEKFLMDNVREVSDDLLASD
jgi:hypothetical protein